MAKQQKTLEIVRATREDLPALIPLFDGYRQFYKQASDLEGARQFLTAHFEENTSVIFLASCTDEEGKRQTCGFTQLYPSFSSVSMKRLWILNDLFVAPEMRQSGAGSALLARARTFAAETEATGLVLTTARDNLTAQKVYEGAGWQRNEEFYTYTISFS